MNLVPPLTAEDVKPGEYQHNILVLNDALQFYWSFEKSDTIISIALVGKSKYSSSICHFIIIMSYHVISCHVINHFVDKGWMGIGFDPVDNGMLNCDMIMCWINPEWVFFRTFYSDNLYTYRCSQNHLSLVQLYIWQTLQLTICKLTLLLRWNNLPLYNSSFENSTYTYRFSLYNLQLHTLQFYSITILQLFNL